MGGRSRLWKFPPPAGVAPDSLESRVNSFPIKPPKPITIDILTAREREVVAHIACGKTTNEIAQILGIAFKTVASHRHRILDKLRAKNVAEMMLTAHDLGLVSVSAVQPPSEDVCILY